MKRILHYGLVLSLIAIIISGTLGKLNQTTSVIIVESKKEKIKSSRKIVLPVAD